MHHGRDRAPSGVTHLLVIATIIAVVVFGLSAMSGDVQPFQGRRFWLLVGIALAPMLALDVVIWLVQRERYASRRSYRRAK
jgi:hypothetical protein